jgi:hypothetical protein
LIAFWIPNIEHVTRTIGDDAERVRIGAGIHSSSVPAARLRSEEADPRCPTLRSYPKQHAVTIVVPGSRKISQFYLSPWDFLKDLHLK